MKNKIKISVVSYLNSKPFLYGIENSDIKSLLEISTDIPSECARKLSENEVDIGLIPVAVLPQINNANIISDFCIGAVGAVKTVSIFSEVPINELENLFLDYQSRSSVLLTKILLKNYWKLNINLLPAPVDFIDRVKGTTGAVIIGDRTIGLENKFSYIYDLSEAWLTYSQLPFVFAAWVSNKKLDSEFLEKFNAALKNGIDNSDLIAENFQHLYPEFDIKKYYTAYISYTLDDDKKKGMNLFLDHIKNLK